MTSIKRHLSSICGFALVLTCLSFSITAQPAHAQTLTVAYSFSSQTDGGQPYAQLVHDEAGNAYGTAAIGGEPNSCGGEGCGVVFKITKNGHYSVLYTFIGGTDGANPWSGLLRDAAGNLYGTTEAGGSASAGTVYELSPSGQKTILYNFQGGNDGAYPFAALTADSAGNLYGTTYKGGTSGFGTVYKISSAGETVLYSFKGGADGQYPYASVVRDPAGNLYGTTLGDGFATYGTLYRLTPAGKETVVHTFTGGADGGFPFYGGLIRDPAGNLYGTTSYGGAFTFFGTVFKMSTAGQYGVLYSFSGRTDGGQPNTSVIRDAAGNLYGATVSGGALGHGTIFKLDVNNQETVLYSFKGETDPANPSAPLSLDAHGNLYGCTVGGGQFAEGTIFRLTQ